MVNLIRHLLKLVKIQLLPPHPRGNGGGIAAFALGATLAEFPSAPNLTWPMLLPAALWLLVVVCLLWRIFVVPRRQSALHEKFKRDGWKDQPVPRFGQFNCLSTPRRRR